MEAESIKSQIADEMHVELIGANEYALTFSGTDPEIVSRGNGPAGCFWYDALHYRERPKYMESCPQERRPHAHLRNLETFRRWNNPGRHVPLAISGSNLVRHLLCGSPANDIRVYGGATLMTDKIGLLACYVPARRAALLDPATALREE